MDQQEYKSVSIGELIEREILTYLNSFGHFRENNPPSGISPIFSKLVMKYIKYQSAIYNLACIYLTDESASTITVVCRKQHLKHIYQERYEELFSYKEDDAERVDPVHLSNYLNITVSTVARKNVRQQLGLPLSSRFILYPENRHRQQNLTQKYELYKPRKGSGFLSAATGDHIPVNQPPLVKIPVFVHPIPLYVSEPKMYPYNAFQPMLPQIEPQFEYIPEEYTYNEDTYEDTYNENTYNEVTYSEDTYNENTFNEDVLTSYEKEYGAYMLDRSHDSYNPYQNRHQADYPLCNIEDVPELRICLDSDPSTENLLISSETESLPSVTNLETYTKDIDLETSSWNLLEEKEESHNSEIINEPVVETLKFVSTLDDMKINSDTSELESSERRMCAMIKVTESISSVINFETYTKDMELDTSSWNLLEEKEEPHNSETINRSQIEALEFIPGLEEMNIKSDTSELDSSERRMCPIIEVKTIVNEIFDGLKQDVALSSHQDIETDEEFSEKLTDTKLPKTHEKSTSRKSKKQPQNKTNVQKEFEKDSSFKHPHKKKGKKQKRFRKRNRGENSDPSETEIKTIYIDLDLSKLTNEGPQPSPSNERTSASPTYRIFEDPKYQSLLERFVGSSSILINSIKEEDRKELYESQPILQALFKRFPNKTENTEKTIHIKKKTSLDVERTFEKTSIAKAKLKAASDDLFDIVAQMYKINEISKGSPKKQLLKPLTDGSQLIQVKDDYNNSKSKLKGDVEQNEPSENKSKVNVSQLQKKAIRRKCKLSPADEEKLLKSSQNQLPIDTEGPLNAEKPDSTQIRSQNIELETQLIQVKDDYNNSKSKLKGDVEQNEPSENKSKVNVSQLQKKAIRRKCKLSPADEEKLLKSSQNQLPIDTEGPLNAEKPDSTQIRSQNIELETQLIQVKDDYNNSKSKLKGDVEQNEPSENKSKVNVSQLQKKAIRRKCKLSPADEEKLLKSSQNQLPIDTEGPLNAEKPDSTQIRSQNIELETQLIQVKDDYNNSKSKLKGDVEQNEPSENKSKVNVSQLQKKAIRRKCKLSPADEEKLLKSSQNQLPIDTEGPLNAEKPDSTQIRSQNIELETQLIQVKDDYNNSKSKLKGDVEQNEPSENKSKVNVSQLQKKAIRRKCKLSPADEEKLLKSSQNQLPIDTEAPLNAEKPDSTQIRSQNIELETQLIQVKDDYNNSKSKLKGDVEQNEPSENKSKGNDSKRQKKTIKQKLKFSPSANEKQLLKDNKSSQNQLPTDTGAPLNAEKPDSTQIGSQNIELESQLIQVKDDCNNSKSELKEDVEQNKESENKSKGNDSKPQKKTIKQKLNFSLSADEEQLLNDNKSSQNKLPTDTGVKNDTKLKSASLKHYDENEAQMRDSLVSPKVERVLERPSTPKYTERLETTQNKQEIKPAKKSYTDGLCLSPVAFTYHIDYDIDYPKLQVPYSVNSTRRWEDKAINITKRCNLPIPAKDSKNTKMSDTCDQPKRKLDKTENTSIITDQQNIDEKDSSPKKSRRSKNNLKKQNQNAAAAAASINEALTKDKNKILSKSTPDIIEVAKQKQDASTMTDRKFSKTYCDSSVNTSFEEYGPLDFGGESGKIKFTVVREYLEK